VENNNQGWIGDALSGMGAGLSGKGVQWQQAQTLAKREKRELDLQEQEMRVKAGFTDLITRKSMADAGDWGGVLNQLQSRYENLQSLTPMPGGSDDDTRIHLQLAQIAVGDGPDAMEARKQLMSGMTRGMELGVGLGYLSGTTGNKMQFGDSHIFKDTEDNLFQGTQRRNPRTGEVESVLSPVGHNNAQVGGLSKVDSLGLTAPQAVQQAGNIAGATTTATLTSELALKPNVAAAVEQAKQGVIATYKNKDLVRSNEVVLQTYDTAMNSLTEALGGTLTGPVAGWLPAITTSQQIAQGAGAMMAPILKSMFRESGEGVFTDKDQELLTAMLPDRKDTQETIAWKIKSIDDIVRSKLGLPKNPGNVSPSGAASTGTSNGFKVVSVEEGQ
jgi:hypothetical protein